jgi:hypothetical protein
MSKKYNLYPEDQYADFANLMLMVEAAEDTNPEEDQPEEKDPAQVTEDEVFNMVKDAPDYPSETNATLFLGRQPSGEFGSVSDINSPNDPSIRGIGIIITGDILTDSESIVNYLDPLFEKVGLNDIDPEDFKKIMPSIWKKLEEFSGRDPLTAYGQFQKYSAELVNQLRTDKQLQKIDEKPSDSLTK